MYWSFYHLNRDPFGPPVDGRHICPLASSRTALLTIVRSIVARKPFVAVMGSPGSGKTTVLNAALAALADRIQVVRISARNSTASTLHQSAEELFGISDRTAHSVLVIDHAQYLALESLNRLALLTKLTRDGPRGLQVVLVGPVDLLEALPASGLLRVEAKARAVIEPLSLSEAARYLAYRVQQGGGNVDEIFSAPATAYLLRAANGNPGRIDAILRRVLELGAYCRSIQVTPELISEVIVAQRRLMPDPEAASYPAGSAARNGTPLVPQTSGLLLRYRGSAIPVPAPRFQTNRRAYTVVAASLMLAAGAAGLWQPWAWTTGDQVANASLEERLPASASSRISAMSAAMIERLKAELIDESDSALRRQIISESPQARTGAGIRFSGTPIRPSSEARPIPIDVTLAAADDDLAAGPERGERQDGAASEQAADPGSSPPGQDMSDSRDTPEPATEHPSPTENAGDQPGAGPDMGGQAKLVEPTQTTSRTPGPVHPDSVEPPAQPKPQADAPANDPTQALEPGAIGPRRETASTASLAPDVVAALSKRGDAMLQLGNVSGARSAYERAASGSGHAAAGAGKTYDPGFLGQIGARGTRPDPVAAADWYRKAIALGDPEAGSLLQNMGESTSSR